MTKDAVAGRIRRLLAMADKRAQDLGIPDTEANLTPDMLDRLSRGVTRRRPHAGHWRPGFRTRRAGSR